MTDAGTPVYVAPEVWVRRYGYASDVYSLGVVAFHVWTGQLPWWDPTVGESMPSDMSGVMEAVLSGETDQMARAVLARRTRRKRPPSDDHVEADDEKDEADEDLDLEEGLVELVVSMLAYDPRRRPTAQEVMKHPWVAAATSSSPSSSSGGEEGGHGDEVGGVGDVWMMM